MVLSIMREIKKKKEGRWGVLKLVQGELPMGPHWDGGALNAVSKEVAECTVGRVFYPGEDFSRQNSKVLKRKHAGMFKDSQKIIVSYLE